jgi:hypothetical protein
MQSTATLPVREQERNKSAIAGTFVGSLSLLPYQYVTPAAGGDTKVIGSAHPMQASAETASTADVTCTQ